jgi:type I restriction enzyme S subunit
VSEMPSGWVQAPLGQVATSQLGRMLSASRETGDHPKPYLRNRDVQWGHINVDELPVMDFGPNDAARFLLHRGDVLVCEGGEVGRSAIWHGQLTECYYQKALHRVRVSAALCPEFLLYLLRHYARTRAFERYTSGTTIAHLPQEDLRNLPVPIPPTAEQKRITAAIEEQFSRLDAGVAALERARQNLKRMRAAVLQAAVTGRLVHQDLAEGTGTDFLAKVAQSRGGAKSPVAVSANLSVPETWAVASLEAVTDPHRVICYGILMPKVKEGGTVPYVEVKDLRANRLDLASLHRTSTALHSEFSRSQLNAGDVVLAIRGSYDRALVVPAEIAGANVSRDVARIARYRGLPHPSLQPI